MSPVRAVSLVGEGGDLPAEGERECEGGLERFSAGQGPDRAGRVGVVVVDDFDVLAMDPQLELSGRHVEEEVGGVGDEGRDCAFQ